MCYALFTPLAIAAGWFPLNAAWLAIYTAIWFAVYIVLWGIAYLIGKKEILALNTRLNSYSPNTGE